MQISAGYLWFKALHVAFMVTWFAGLFYLPRLFIYHAEARDDASLKRFCIMEKRLFIIMTIGAILTAVFGLTLLTINSALLSQDWFKLKLVLLTGLVVYHVRCWQWIVRLETGHLPDNTRWLRWYNEIPTIFLLGIIILTVVKPI